MRDARHPTQRARYHRPRGGRCAATRYFDSNSLLAASSYACFCGFFGDTPLIAFPEVPPCDRAPQVAVVADERIDDVVERTDGAVAVCSGPLPKPRMIGVALAARRFAPWVLRATACAPADLPHSHRRSPARADPHRRRAAERSGDGPDGNPAPRAPASAFDWPEQPQYLLLLLRDRELLARAREHAPLRPDRLPHRRRDARLHAAREQFLV